jgi:hypothetical protein
VEEIISVQLLLLLLLQLCDKHAVILHPQKDLTATWFGVQVDFDIEGTYLLMVWTWAVRLEERGVDVDVRRMDSSVRLYRAFGIYNTKHYL